jgi:hypothetical protein
MLCQGQEEHILILKLIAFGNLALEVALTRDTRAVQSEFSGVKNHHYITLPGLDTTEDSLKRNHIPCLHFSCQHVASSGCQDWIESHSVICSFFPNL